MDASLHIVLIYASSAFFPITLSKKLDPLPDLSKKNIRLCWYHRKIFFQNIIITSWIIGILKMPDIFQLFTFSVKSTYNHSFITSTIQDILPVIVYSKFEIAYLKLSAVCEYLSHRSCSQSSVIGSGCSLVLPSEFSSLHLAFIASNSNILFYYNGLEN